jgi:hypothetical protein
MGLRAHFAAETAELAVSVGRDLALRIVTEATPGDPGQDEWLAGLRESAVALGGRMDLVTGTRGTGAEIVWTVPLDPR